MRRMRLGTFVFLGIAALGTYYFLKADSPAVAKIRSTAKEAVPRYLERTRSLVRESIDDTYRTYCRIELEQKIREYERRFK